MGAREVAAGAKWLDENFPGWEREIDLGSLNINSCEDCILGQSLRKFAGQRWKTGWAFGNHVMDTQEGNGQLGPSKWKMIVDATCETNNEPFWRELIKERFSTGNLSDAEGE